jgi:hypothetical protein
MAGETRGLWAARIARWQRSGLTATACAARERVKAGTLSDWKGTLRQGDRRVPGGAARPLSFVELVAPGLGGAEASVEIGLPAGYRVRLAAGAAAATLRTVLDVLEARR